MDKKETFKLKFSPKKYLGRIVVAAIVILLSVFLIRTKLWEDDYYSRMEGSERAAAGSAGDVAASEEVDETPVTEQQKTEYTVAADRPRFLTIEKLGVLKARIMPLGVTKTGQMQTPLNIFDAGWYMGSAAPGAGGTSIFDGHNGGPTASGIFKKLPSLTSGDLITIEMGDGAVYNYRVYDNRTIPLADAGAQMNTLRVSPVDGVESISIISCSGDWSEAQRTYLSRQFVRATRI